MAVSPQHAVLVAATVATMTFDEDFDKVELMNVTGTSPVYARFDGIAPVVAAAGTHVIPAVAGATIIRKPKTSGPTVIKFISAGTPTVSARGVVE
jgi:hypothetical protein